VNEWMVWAIGLLVAWLLGEAWFRFRKAHEFIRGVLAGQRQAELTAGRRPTEVNVGCPGDESWALLDKRQIRSHAQRVEHDL
jgi:hypothetical protein